MNKLFTITLFFTLLFASTLLSSCKNNIEKLQDDCEELSSIKKLTDDCNLMGEKLSKQLEKLTPQIKDLHSQKDLSQNTKREYIRALMPCTQNLLEITNGTCKDNEKIQTALDKLENLIEN